MDLGLSGRVALVNGASQGIGYGIAHTLAAEGARVAIAERRQPALQAPAERIRDQTSAENIAIKGDIRNGENCSRLAAQAGSRFGSRKSLNNKDCARPFGS